MGKTVDLSLPHGECFWLSLTSCFSHRRWSGFILVMNYIVSRLHCLSYSQQGHCRKGSVDGEELDISCLETLQELARVGAAVWIAILAYPVTQEDWAYLEGEVG